MNNSMGDNPVDQPTDPPVSTGNGSGDPIGVKLPPQPVIGGQSFNVSVESTVNTTVNIFMGPVFIENANFSDSATPSTSFSTDHHITTVTPGTIQNLEFQAPAVTAPAQSHVIALIHDETGQVVFSQSTPVTILPEA